MPTYLSNVLNTELLKQALEAGHVRTQTHPQHPNLVIYNYTDQCVWDKAWNSATLECRGLIADQNDGEVHARPFRKFFNYGEGEIPAELAIGAVEVTDKMDGSLGIGYLLNGLGTVATRGSFASDQAQWATKWLREDYNKKRPPFQPPEGWTPLWEIVYPQNRIVLDYGLFEGLVLLGWRNIATGKLEGPYEFPDHWWGYRTEVMPAFSLGEALTLEPRKNAEGVVVRWQHSGLQVKIKQEDYILMHGIVTNTTNRRVWEMLSNGLDPLDVEGVPDEFRAWLEKTTWELQREHFNQCVQARIAFAGIWEECLKLGLYTVGDLGQDIVDRKEFALRAKEHPRAKALFMLLDGKDIGPWMWGVLKPQEIVRPFGGVL